MVEPNFYRNASFLTSAALLSQAPPDNGYEVAFVGRSNSGKSTAINILCDQKGLCRTSKTPGRTQLINFFRLDNDRRLVDLPGYGYAQAPGEKQLAWQDSMTDYLTNRGCLRGLILLMDIRHPLQDYDQNMLRWAAMRSLPVHILLTKADKLKRGPAISQLNLVQQQLADFVLTAEVQAFSAPKRQGIEQVHAKLNDWLAFPASFKT